MGKNYTIKFYRKKGDKSKYAKVYINDILYCKYIVLSQKEVREYLEDDEMFCYDEHFKIGDKYYQTYIDVEIMEYYICEVMDNVYLY